MEPITTTPGEQTRAAPSRGGLRALLAAVFLAAVLGAVGVTSVFAQDASASPSASPGATDEGGTTDGTTDGTRLCPNKDGTQTDTGASSS
jgi:hypothetical protein